MHITEVDVETGETVERSLTKDEQQQADADRKAGAALEQAEQDRLDAIANASTVAELKFALGLSGSV